MVEQRPFKALAAGSSPAQPKPSFALSPMGLPREIPQRTVGAEAARNSKFAQQTAIYLSTNGNALPTLARGRDICDEKEPSYNAFAESLAAAIWSLPEICVPRTAVQVTSAQDEQTFGLYHLLVKQQRLSLSE
jgi:hypothetical protein